MKRNLLTALMAIITACSVHTTVQAETSFIPIVDVSQYKSYALNSRGVTDSLGIRTYFGRYMVVVGREIEAVPGDYVDIITSDGHEIPCVVLDVQGIASSYGDCVIKFVVDEEKISGDMKRYKTVSVNERLSGGVDSVRVYTGADYRDIHFDSYVNDNHAGGKRLVINKKSLTIGGKKFFFVYYADSGNINVKQVTEDKYNNIKVDWSVIDV